MFTGNYFGETLQLETLDQTKQNCWQLRSSWRVVGDTMITFQSALGGERNGLMCHIGKRVGAMRWRRHKLEWCDDCRISTVLLALVQRVWSGLDRRDELVAVNPQMPKQISLLSPWEERMMRSFGAKTWLHKNLCPILTDRQSKTVAVDPLCYDKSADWF